MRPPVRTTLLRALGTAGSVAHRQYRGTVQKESVLIFGGVGLALGAMGARYAVQTYNNQRASKERSEGSAPGGADASTSGPAADSASTQGQADATMDAFASIGGSWAEFKKTFFAKGYYDGGFEDKMSRREAALVLGVRESTSAERVKEAHRRVLLLNHPDRGGSAYMAAKINEAKDLLLKGTGQK